MARQITVEIDSLVLHGFEGVQRERIAAALEEALRSRLARPGAVEQLRRLHGSGHIDAGEISVGRGGSEVLGGALGRAVHTALAPADGRPPAGPPRSGAITQGGRER